MIYEYGCAIKYKRIVDPIDTNPWADSTWIEVSDKNNDPSLAIGPQDWLLLEISFSNSGFASDTTIKELTQYLSFDFLQSLSPDEYDLQGHVFDSAEWSEQTDTSILLSYIADLSPSSCPWAWIDINPDYWWIGDGSLESPIYMLISSKNNRHEFPGKEVAITYNEKYEYYSYGCTTVDFEIVDNYNNTFTVNILYHDFPPTTNIVVQCYDGISNFGPIELDTPIKLDIDYSEMYLDQTRVYVEVQMYVPDGISQSFGAEKYINQYIAPTRWYRQVLRHVYYSKYDNSIKNIPADLVIEPQLDNKWSCLWDVQQSNSNSQICGQIIRLYKNGEPINLTAEYNKDGSIVRKFDYCYWDSVSQKFCLLEDGLGGENLITDTNYVEWISQPDRWSLATEQNIGDTDYDGYADTEITSFVSLYNFSFYPSDFGFEVGDILKIEIQDYTRYGVDNDGDMLLGPECSTIYEITGITEYNPSEPEEPEPPEEPDESENTEKKNILKIKTSENTFETGEVLIKTEEGWIAALEVLVKTSEGWQNSIE